MLATGTLSVLSVARDLDTQPWLDRLILADFAAAAAAGLVGIELIVSGVRPSDALHVVYGAILIPIIAAGRYLGRRRRGRPQAAWLLASLVISVGILVRLVMTA